MNNGDAQLEAQDPENSSVEAEGGNLPVPVPDGELTLPPERLAGSFECLNCGTVLQGPFCHYCGQPDKNFMRFFPVLLRELLEDFLDFDSRFMRTMKPLLFKPGKLTRDYLDGRRFRYTPPLRLYIFSSIACFFMAAVIAADSIQIHTNGEDGDVLTGLHIGAEQDAEVQEALDRLDPETRQVVDEALQQAAESGAEEGGEDDNTITFNDKPWDRETNPLVIGWAPDWVNEWVNDEIEQSPAKGRQIEENPDLIKDKVFDVLPATMFVLLPIVALLFKFWYLFARKYYIEHLIFALHNHSFLYVMLLIVMLSSWVAGLVEPDGEGRLAEALSWIYIAVAIWIPLYFLFSLKRVYQQGWAMTITKYCLIGISYVVLLSFATAFVALLSFVLL
jgi:drug/metabolite transporter superfamily protein YnfA